MSEFIQPTPIEAAFAAELSANVASEAAAEAISSAQEAIEYINSHRGEIETEFEEITWTIDRTGDRNMLNLINLNSYDTNTTIYTNVYQTSHNTLYNDVTPTIPFLQEKLITIYCEELEISDEDQNCCICMEKREKNDICELNCKHKFCGFCVEKCVKRPDTYNCSLCREHVVKIVSQNIEIKEKLQDYCF